jgi:hypothetical protein
VLGSIDKYSHDRRSCEKWKAYEKNEQPPERRRMTSLAKMVDAIHYDCMEYKVHEKRMPACGSREDQRKN